MGSRFLLWVFLLVGIFLAPLAKVEAQNWKDVTYNTCGGDGAFITGQQLVAGINMPPGLRTGDLTWSFPAELTAAPSDPKALDPVISGFVHGQSYLVYVRTNSNGHNYRITINASESIGAYPYVLTSVNGTGDVLLDNSTSYPVPFELSPTDGGSYQYYYSNGDDISGTSGPRANPNWSFSPTNQTEVYSVYGVVNKTVGGLACKAKSNEIQIADEKVVLEVVGGGSICDGATTPLPLSVKPYVNTYTYTWYKDGGVVGAGDSHTINRSGGSWTGAYSVVVTNGVTVIATSEDVEVGAYQLTAGLIANGPTAFCGDISAELTGSALSTEGNNLDYRWENSGAAVPAGSGFIASGAYNISDTETFTTTGSYRFVVRESDNPLCYAQSPAVLVESTIEANPMTVTGSSACEGGSISNITLLSSEAGVTYRLMHEDGSGTKVMVQEWDSDGTSYTFSAVSAVGSYTVEATGCNGVVQMNGGPFVISALPNETLPVVLSGSGCEGASHTITVQGSEADVSYQLFRGATAATLAITSTGGDLTFSGVTIAGDYTVRATRNTTCTVTLDQGVRIGVVPAAQTFSPSTACADTPFTLTLANSEAGVQYTIYNAANASLYSQNSGGGPLSFTVNQPEGTYTIVAQNDDGCTRDIGSFTLQAPPITTYTLETAATPACAVNGPHTISLSNSQPGFTYRLLRGATVVSSVVAPAAGGRLDLASTSVAGTYTVEVSNDGCMLPMPTSLTIVAQPSDIPVEAGDYCDGDDVEVRLNTSQNGAIYRLYRDGLLYASEVEVTGTGGAIVFADKFPPGTYTVGASFVSGDCERMMTGDVVVNALPNVEINPFSDHYCADAGTVTIGGRPQVGTNDWWVSGFTTNPTWFTETGSTATINVIDLLDTQLGASDRVGLTFNYHYQDPVTGCEASASELITFVDDQSDNLDFEYRMAATEPWSNFAGDRSEEHTLDDI